MGVLPSRKYSENISDRHHGRVPRTTAQTRLRARKQNTKHLHTQHQNASSAASRSPAHACSPQAIDRENISELTFLWQLVAVGPILRWLFSLVYILLQPPFRRKRSQNNVGHAVFSFPHTAVPGRSSFLLERLMANAFFMLCIYESWRSACFFCRS